MVKFALMSCAEFYRVSLTCAVLAAMPLLGFGQKLMKALQPHESGISFINYVSDTSYMVRNSYVYAVNGGGVAIADFNNDGLEDVVFSSNYGVLELYVNKGNLKFELARQTGLIAKDWCTALIASDVNGDGLVDLYVCRSSCDLKITSRNNLLFINKGNFQFEESAASWGIDNDGNSTGAVFFDFDLDGDLDLYVVNGPYAFFNQLSYNIKPVGRYYGTDVLYENVGGKMVLVNERMGIIEENAFGLSVTAADINNDGWPDLFVANDFIYEDFILINNQGKGFDYKTKRMIGHGSFFTMGTDVNDFNNDGLPDLLSVDMLQDDLRKFKWESTINTYDFYENLQEIGGHTQYIRNCLQLNRGDGTFSEIAELAGVAATDWSWSCLFVDLDNDGWKDIYISNGVRYKANIDYLLFESQQNRMKRPSVLDQPIPYQPKPGEAFGPRIENKSKINIADYPKEVIPNFVFRNNRDLTFTNVRSEWGMDQVVNANGAAYADLDNDGDLDLVVNNHNDTSIVYQNLSNTDKSKTHFIQFKVKGYKLNTDHLGAKIFVYTPKSVQYQEITRTRGFQSSSQAIAHFGLGEDYKIDSVVAVSPYGLRKIVLKNPAINKLHHLDFGSSELTYSSSVQKPEFFLHTEDTTRLPSFRHKENPYQDFKREPLLTQIFSRLGPGMAVGDVNGDGFEDFFIGGASGQSGELWLQNQDGSFIRSTSNPWSQHQDQEDMGVLLFDVDGDVDLDLYIASGGNEELEETGFYRDRLYINDGKGNFSFASDQLEDVQASASCVVAGDFDNDGDLDVFVGGRILTGQYPLPPRSFLLRNENGKLVDRTEQIAPGLERVGLVSGALWTDFDDDGDLDLIVVGQWMPITVFENVKGKFQNSTEKLGLNQHTGWWNSITGADLDNDGDTDYIIGNLGLNSRLKASPEQPLSIYALDFDNNTSLDAITFMYNDGINQPIHRYAKITDQLLVFRRRFLKVKDYAYADLNKVIPPDFRNKAYHRTAAVLYSSVLINQGKGRFKLVPLPNLAQIAPVFGLQTGDYDLDGYLDILITGNCFGFEIETGRADASRGLLLLGDGKFNFKPVEVPRAGFRVPGDAKSLVRIDQASGRQLFAASQNNDRLLLFHSKLTLPYKYVPDTKEKSVKLVLENGVKRKVEFYWGDGYLSQNSRSIMLPRKLTP